MTETQKRLDRLQAQGFDRSSIYTNEGSAIRVRCSQCEVMAIQGVFTHETGCPNVKHECKGCNATVERRGAYCEDCQ